MEEMVRQRRPLRLLVTGAGGYCGRHAVKHFTEAEGYAVAAMIRPGSAPPEAAAGCTVVGCDLADRQAVAKSIAKISPDAVLHLAGANHAGASWKDPAGYLEANLMGTVHLLEAVRLSAPSCRIIVAGSMLGYRLPEDGPPRPPHPYSLSKTFQRAAALSWHSMYGMDIIAAEPCNLIGPGPSGGLNALLARYAAACEKAAAEGEEPPLPFPLSSRTEKRDFLDVRDAVRGYEAILRGGLSGATYAMGSGRMRSLGELADLYLSLAACPLEIQAGDSEAASPPPADASALAALGWSAGISLEQSCSDTLEEARRALKR
ncbi:NAD-dependent epimerase/dehydratase family protein [Paenibacillus humicus]|uniref:NAD-dependent epimerase/dehydratase family protein n=1 Tax=Paenibacillus humicus TaxID=412861 RepID=UPI003F5CF067